MIPKTEAKKVAQLALTKKAYDVLIMDLRKLTTITDYFVVCTADSDTQVKAVADAISEGMAKLGDRPWHEEGYTNRSWILLDFVDVVVHVFHKDVRKFYNLERLWGDAPIEHIGDDDVAKQESKQRSKKLTPRKKAVA
ncbi:MAG: ribosome silencing factor [Bacteroidota bacterium]